LPSENVAMVCPGLNGHKVRSTFHNYHKPISYEYWRNALDKKYCSRRDALATRLSHKYGMWVNGSSPLY